VPSLTRLETYRDERGNSVDFPGVFDQDIKIKFTGSDNRLVVDGACARGLRGLTVAFDCDNGLVEIKGSTRGFSASIRVGQDSRVLIGEGVSSTNTVGMSSTEGTTITVGDDVMFASNNQVRADDAHPIFDVRTGRRVNVSTSIEIGHHVWLGREAAVLAGARIGDGTTIGYASVVTGRIPNNCVAAGSPARVLRRDTVWERTHLSLRKPFYKPDPGPIAQSPYWRVTEDDDTSDAPAATGTLARWAARRRRWLPDRRDPRPLGPVSRPRPTDPGPPPTARSMLAG
jgi:acetyltransferase-like isoleucine patch superfamily enzyme